MRLAYLILAGVLAMGCGDDDGPSGDAGGRDSGSTDSGSVDSGGTDSGGTDSGGVDGGSDDAGGADTGTEDGGGTDAGDTDAGGLDAGDRDGGDACEGITLGMECTGPRSCGPDYECRMLIRERYCAPPDDRPTCGGIIGSRCTTRTYTECLLPSGIADALGVCVTPQEEDCACAQAPTRFTNCRSVRP